MANITKILAFDFDLCVCDGEGFFDLFTQLLDVYEFTRSKAPGSLPEGFVKAVERSYKTLAIDVAAATNRGQLYLFRPGLERVFQTVQQMKRGGLVDYVMFYSNNTCPEFLSFLELVVRLAYPTMGLSPAKPVIELVFTANTSSRVKTEYAPTHMPNARLKTRAGMLTCLQDLDLPLENEVQILFFDDMDHPDLNAHLKLVPAYKALHTADQISTVFYDCFTRTGLFVDGFLRPEWKGLNIHNTLLKTSADDFLKWLRLRDLPTSINMSSVRKENIISDSMIQDILRFCDASTTQAKKRMSRRQRRIGI